MEEAHRKTPRPTRATNVKTEEARASYGPKKAITWWDTPDDTPKTGTHMANRSKTKSSMVIRPKYTQTGHKPGDKTKSLIAKRPKPTYAGLRVVHKPRPKTESLMAIGPNPTGIRSEVSHKPRPNTTSFMKSLGTFMANGVLTSNIQQRGKEIPNYTVKSSRSGVFGSIGKLSFLV